MPLKAINSLPPLAVVRSSSALPKWQLGQLLTAEVIGTPRQNYTQLRIGDRLVNARTELPLRAGEKLDVRVSATTPEVTLKLVAPNNSREAIAPALVRGLARSLPQQGSAGDTLTLLRALTRNPATATTTSTPALPPTLATRAANWLAQVPERTALSDPATLRGALEQASRPAERLLHVHLDRGETTPAPRELRAALEHMRRALPGSSAPPAGVAAAPRTSLPPEAANVAPAPRFAVAEARPPAPPAAEPGVVPVDDGGGIDLPRLRELFDGAIARTQSHHLHNAASHGTPGTPLVLELPVRHQERVDLWRFELTEDAHARDGTSDTEISRAGVTIRLLLGDDLAFSAQLRIAGDTVGIRMGSNDARLNSALEQDAPRLGERMQQHGLAVAALVIDEGITRPAPRAWSQRLVDEHA